MTGEGKAKAALSAAAAAALFAVLAVLAAPRLRRSLPVLSDPVVFSTAAVDSSRLRGRPYVADFIFTSCGGPCPLLSANMARLQERLPESVSLVSFTVDPEHDTAEVLADYARALGARPGRWFFVRLEPGPLYELANAGFRLPLFNDPKAPPEARVIHTTKLVLVDARGAVRGYYDGLSDADLASLARDARRLAEEKTHV